MLYSSIMDTQDNGAKPPKKKARAKARAWKRHEPEVIDRINRLAATKRNAGQISRLTGVPASTIRQMLQRTAAESVDVKAFLASKDDIQASHLAGNMDMAQRLRESLGKDLDTLPPSVKIAAFSAFNMAAAISWDKLFKKEVDKSFNFSLIVAQSCKSGNNQPIEVKGKVE